MCWTLATRYAAIAFLVSKLLRIVGYIWAGLLFATVLVGAISILIFQGIGRLWEVFSPFNIWNWGLIFVLALPAVGMFKLADRLEKA